MKRRDFLKGTASVGAALAAGGCAGEDAIPEGVASYEALNRAVPDTAFDAERILPANPYDPVKLPPGKSRRVLVVGGGLAGLSSALELAERGYQVVLKEAAPILGGRLHTRTERLRTGTFKVEHGLHMWFYQYYNFSDVLRRLDLLDNFQPFEEVYFKFRNYQTELIRSVGPYPFNLINIIKESPNLNLLDAAATFGAVGDIIFYDHDSNWRRFDRQSFAEWGRRTRVNKKFWDIIMYPAASVTLNDPAALSAAEMLLYMHFFFIGHPKAFRRAVTTRDHGSAVIEPWAARLATLGVDLRLSSPVVGLKVQNGRAVGEIGDPTVYDHVVIAGDVPGTKAILESSVALDARSSTALGRVRAATRGLSIAPHYKVLRVWLDKGTGTRPFHQSVIETPEHHPINLLALFHMLEDESKDWAARTGGSVIEFHLYNTPHLAGLGEDEVWNRIRPIAEEILPEIRGARALDFSMGSFDNFTSFGVGEGLGRPTPNFPRLQAGLPNLALAGDWVHALFPCALMERAVATGREAANDILLQDRVRQSVVYTAKKRGPGILPRF